MDNQTNDDITPQSPPASQLGMRIGIGLLGLVILGMFVLLGQAALKQADTTRALQTYESRQQVEKPINQPESYSNAKQ